MSYEQAIVFPFLYQKCVSSVMLVFCSRTERLPIHKQEHTFKHASKKLHTYTQVYTCASKC